MNAGKLCMSRSLWFTVMFLLTHSLNAQNLVSASASTYYQPSIDQNMQVQGLEDVLQTIELEKGVNFVFQSGLVKGKKVSQNVDLSKDTERILTRILTPLSLTFKKSKHDTYVILAKVDSKFTQSSIEGPQKKAQSQLMLKQITTGENVFSSEVALNAFPVFNVTGKVTDAEGNPLQGATVLESGTSNGNLTGPDGSYSLDVADENASLVISFVGYSSQTIPVNGRAVIDIQLQLSNMSLDEVVVIGYGTRDRKDLTGAVGQISREEIEQSEYLSPELALQGRVAGVFVGSPSSNPGDRPNIQIRGIGTLGFNEPLYVIDGVPLAEFGSGAVYTVDPARANDLRGTQNIFNLINPNDIESISVLKDASAAAIYGVRAANGVILITTKRGSAGKPTVRFNISRGLQFMPDRYDVLDVDQYTQLYQEAYANNTAASDQLPDVFNPDSAAFLGNLPFIDWQEEIINDNAVVEDYSLTVSGGNQGSTYAISAGYARTESPLKFNDLQRYTLSANSDHKITKWLELGESFRFAYSKSRAENGGGTPLGFNVRSAPPWQPIYNPEGPGGFQPVRTVDEDFNVIEETLFGPEQNFNLIATPSFGENDVIQLRVLGSVYAQIQPFPGLKIKGSLGGDYLSQEREQFQQIERLFFRDGNPDQFNSYSQRISNNVNFYRDVTINFNRTFKDHFVDLVLSASDQEFGVEVLSGETRGGFRTVGPAAQRVDPGLADNTSSETAEERTRLQGYLARLSYSFKNKYYIDGTIRRDGTSRFAPDFRFGTFPSFAAAWRISEESFMRDISFINDLKIRGGWGELGNQETRAFAFLSLVSPNPRYILGPGAAGIPVQAASLPDFPVIDLSWEVSTSSSVGFEGVFWKNRINLTAEYYRRDTEGILQVVDIPLVVGNINPPVLNVASVRNQGFEVEAGYNQSFGDLNISFSGNFTLVDNEVTSLANNGEPVGGNRNRIEEGQPINFLWGLKTDGIIQNQAELDEYTSRISNPGNDAQLAPGDFRFQDLFGPGAEETGERLGAPDSVINGLDNTFLGSTVAGHYYGFNASAQYKNFDVSLFFQGIGDLQRFNDQRRDGENMSSEGNNQLVSTLDRWTPTNPSRTIPRAVFADPSGNNRFSDRFVEDAGFLRLKNFQVGYTFPADVATFLGDAQSIRVYVSGTNVLTFTPWTGIDPENDVSPPPIIYSLGASLTW